MLFKSSPDGFPWATNDYIEKAIQKRKEFDKRYS